MNENFKIILKTFQGRKLTTTKLKTFEVKKSSYNLRTVNLSNLINLYESFLTKKIVQNFDFKVTLKLLNEEKKTKTYEP